MNIIEVLIPLVPGILLVAFPNALVQRTDSAEDAAKKRSKLRRMGYVLIGVSVLYFILVMAESYRIGDAG